MYPMATIINEDGELEECPTAENKKELFRVASSKILDF